MHHASPLQRRSTHLAVNVKGQMYAAQLKNQARKRTTATTKIIKEIAYIRIQLRRMQQQ